MKLNYCTRHFTRVAALAAVPLLVASTAMIGPALLTLAMGLLGAIVLVLAGMYQWRGWRWLLAECEQVERGQSPTGDAHTALPVEFNEVFTAFSALESRRRKLLDCYQRSLEETRQRLAGLGDGQQMPKPLTAADLEHVNTKSVDTAFTELHKTLTTVRQRMAGLTRLMTILPEPLIILDEGGHIRYLNTSAEHLLGAKLADCAKQSFTTFVNPNTTYADPLGRPVITADTVQPWLANGTNDEVVCDLKHRNGQTTRVSIAMARPTANERERLYTIVAHPLTKQYSQVNSLLGSTRGETVQAVWQGVDHSLHPAAESLQTQVRLLTADVKQSSLRHTLMGRVQALQQISNRVDLYLRINHWFGLAMHNQLPAPMPMELSSFDMARLMADKLNPIVKASKTSIVVHNDGGGWVYADEDWLQTALLGVLWHAGQAATGGMVELHVSHTDPTADQPEGRLTYRLTAPGSVLSAEVLGEWEHAFAGVALPTWLDPETPGYLPGVQLARYLAAQMGGTLTFDSEPSRSLAMQLILPARMPNTNATPADRHDGPAMEELCMGWTLGVA